MVADYDKPEPGLVLAAMGRILKAEPTLLRELQIYCYLFKKLPESVDREQMLRNLGAESADTRSRAVEQVERAFLSLNGQCGQLCAE